MPLSEEQIILTVRQPESEFGDRGVRRIREAPLDATHVIRVVFEETAAEIIVVTFYPGRRSRYAGSL